MSGVIQRCQLIAKSSLRRRRILAAAAAAAAVVVIHGTATRADRGDIVLRIVSSNRASSRITMLATVIVVQLMIAFLDLSLAETRYTGK